MTCRPSTKYVIVSNDSRFILGLLCSEMEWIWVKHDATAIPYIFLSRDTALRVAKNHQGLVAVWAGPLLERKCY